VNINNPQLPEYMLMMHRERFEGLNARRSLNLARASRPKLVDDRSDNTSSVTSGVNLGSFSARSGQAVKAYWWVPAGFAVLVLLRSIVGG